MTQQPEARAAETEPPSNRSSETIGLERAKLKMVAGAFRNPENSDLAHYPHRASVRQRIRRTLISLVQRSGLSPLSVTFVDYGKDSGPGVIIPLAESTLVIGGWPKSQDRSLDFFVHFCEREGSNDHKVVRVIDLIGKWLRASVDYSWHNPNGKALTIITV